MTTGAGVEVSGTVRATGSPSNDYDLMPRKFTLSAIAETMKSHVTATDPHSQYVNIQLFTGLIGEFHSAGEIKGWIELDGGVCSRTTDAILWKYALAAKMTVLQSLKDADPVKYAAYFGDGNGKTTFTLPNHHLGHFTRGTPDNAAHGETQKDAIVDITGDVYYISETYADRAKTSGAFQKYGGYRTANTPKSTDSSNTGRLNFAASRVVNTADEVRPKTMNISIKICRGWK